MVISSRTPEGEPNRCPICRHVVQIEPSLDTRDAPCPHCGHLLWFDGDAIDRSAKAGVTLAEVVLEIATKRLGPPSIADREAVVEALEKFGASPDVMERVFGEGKETLGYLGKSGMVDALEKANTAPNWRDLVTSLARKR